VCEGEQEWCVRERKRECACVRAWVCVCVCVDVGALTADLDAWGGGGVKETESGCVCDYWCCYGLSTISRLLKIIDLFRKRALYKRQYSAKKTYHFKEPTNCSQAILPKVHENCCASC